MLTLLISIILVLLFPHCVGAQPVPFEWRGNPIATDYRIFQSTDVGKSWKPVATVPQPTPFPADARVTGTAPFPTPLPAHGLILYKISMRTAQGEEVLHGTGVWKNTLWEIPAISNLGIP